MREGIESKGEEGKREKRVVTSYQYQYQYCIDDYMQLACLGSMDGRIKEKEELMQLRVAEGGVAPVFKASDCHLMQPESLSFQVRTIFKPSSQVSFSAKLVFFISLFVSVCFLLFSSRLANSLSNYELVLDINI